MASVFMLEDLEEVFLYEVLKMLKKEGKINDTIIENMLSWHHSGLNLMIKPTLAIWQDISSVPVFLRKEWFIFWQKNLIVVLPRLFTHLIQKIQKSF
jgi:hypothetical protein